MTESVEIDVSKGGLPSQLMRHMTAKDYNIQGITPDDFIKKHTGSDFDFTVLKAEFAKHCTDYMTDVAMDKPSRAVEFCSKIIYEVGPESRKVAKTTGDKTWKFIFTVENVMHVVFVSTFKAETSVFDAENKATYMVLTIKQAGMIALETFSRVAVLAFANNQTLMTPLAGACYSKDNISDIAIALKKTEIETVVIVNQSCQSGGQHMRFSDPNVAVMACVAATRNVKDMAVRKSIISKLTKQYISMGKMPEINTLRLIAPYATGGIPADLSADNLLELYNDAQKEFGLRKMRQAMKESEIPSNILTPNNSPNRPETPRDRRRASLSRRRAESETVATDDEELYEGGSSIQKIQYTGAPTYASDNRYPTWLLEQLERMHGYDPELGGVSGADSYDSGNPFKPHTRPWLELRRRAKYPDSEWAEKLKIANQKKEERERAAREQAEGSK